MIFRFCKQVLYTAIIVVILHIFVIVGFSYTQTVRDADMVVILGNTVNVDGTLSDRLKSRLNRAKEVYDAKRAQYVIVSGALGKEGHLEGDAMKSYLVQLGLPEDHVIVDNHGVNTNASAHNTKTIATEHGWTSAIVVSNYYHLLRSKIAFQNAGISEVYVTHPKFAELRDVYSLVREIPALWWYVFSR
ncbi:YdcF family protein [Candidatus Nomurabacteria bacterium]|nr:YdcF family protein [Candidatus Nomurabacteria bacterium]